MRFSTRAAVAAGLLLFATGATFAARGLPVVKGDPILVDGFEDGGTRGWTTTVPPSCTDGNTSGNETDVDCGGPDCPDCTNGQLCILDGDCLSSHCFMQVCVECVAATDCPLPPNECQARACTANVCSTVNQPFGIPISSQTAGDCQVVVCNGTGGTTSIPQDSDLPDDGNACTSDSCVAGTPFFTNLPNGIPCPGGTCQNGVCIP
jgi:hypothetical protein